MAFVDNVRGDVLGSVGLAFLLYTVLSMIQKVEEAFNFVWHVERPRSIMRRVSEYLSLMVVGPIFMVVVFGMFGGDREPQLDGLAHVARAVRHHRTGARLPRAVPVRDRRLHVPVRLRAEHPRARPAALSAASCAGILWAATGALFARVVAASTQMVAIYAGFAIVIAALIWIYLSWLILLLGAQLSFYVQNPRYLRVGRGTCGSPARCASGSHSRSCCSIARKFIAGEQPWQQLSSPRSWKSRAARSRP